MNGSEQNEAKRLKKTLFSILFMPTAYFVQKCTDIWAEIDKIL